MKRLDSLCIVALILLCLVCITFLAVWRKLSSDVREVESMLFTRRFISSYVNDSEFHTSHATPESLESLRAVDKGLLKQDYDVLFLDMKIGEYEILIKTPKGVEFCLVSQLWIHVLILASGCLIHGA